MPKTDHVNKDDAASLPLGVSSQCGGKLGHQPEGLCLSQLQPQTRSPQPLLRSFGLPDVAGRPGVVGRPGVLPGVPLAERHPPGTLAQRLML